MEIAGTKALDLAGKTFSVDEMLSSVISVSFGTVLYAE